MASLEEVLLNPFLTENLDSSDFDTTAYQLEGSLDYHLEHILYFRFEDYFNNKGYKLQARIIINTGKNTYRIEYHNDERRKDKTFNSLQEVIDDIQIEFHEKDYSEYKLILDEAIGYLKSSNVNFKYQVNKSHNTYAFLTIYSKSYNDKLHDITINDNKTITVISKYELENMEQLRNTLNLGNKIDIS